MGIKSKRYTRYSSHHMIIKVNEHTEEHLRTIYLMTEANKSRDQKVKTFEDWLMHLKSLQTVDL